MSIIFKKSTVFFGFFCWAVCSLAADGYVKTVELIASSDCDVVSSSPDSSFAYAEELKPDMNGPYDTDGEIIKSYVQFDLPADMGVVTAADFRIIQGLNGDQGSLTYYIFAINDDEVQGNSVNDYTWNNAPGNTPNYLNITWQDHTGYADPTATSYLTTLSVYFAGTEYGLYLTAGLVSALNADTDGVFTLFAHRRQNYAVDPTFAAIENSYGEHGPMLALSYETTGTGIGVSILETDGDTTITEDGGTDSYAVVLDVIPDEPVTILLDADPNLQVTPDMLVFTGADWKIPQTVTVQAIDDQVKQPTLIYTAAISHTAFSNGADYDQIQVDDLLVNIIDNDEVVCADIEPVRQDLNQDCEIDMLDFTLFMEAWLECSDPVRPQECNLNF